MDTGSSLAFQVLSCKKTAWPTETEREGERLVSFKIESAFKFSLKCDDHMVTTLGVNPLTHIGPTHHRLKLN